MRNISVRDIKRNIQYFGGQQSVFKFSLRLLMAILQYACMNIAYLLMRKKKNIKTIVGFSNIYYTGNPRAVFEYMLKHPDKYEVFWAAKNLRTLKDVKRAGGRAFMINGILGIPHFLKADVWVIAHTGMGNIPFLPHKNYKIVQLWHGIGPKGINHKREDYKICDAWCVPSEFSKQRHIILWNAPPEKLYVTGFPEMDMLYKYLKTRKEKLLKEMGIKNGRKIILYAPTFDIGLWPWGDPYEEFEKLCRFCKDKNLILILRLHPYSKIDKRSLKKIIKKYENVYWLDMPKEPNTMKLLAITDILITDWSSIYTDFFLTERPVIFLEVNKEYFTKLRGKPEAPPEYRVGEIVHNNEEFYKALELVLQYGNRFKEEQNELVKIIHGNIDGKASERVVKVIEKLVNKTN